MTRASFGAHRGLKARFSRRSINSQVSDKEEDARIGLYLCVLWCYISAPTRKAQHD